MKRRIVTVVCAALALSACSTLDKLNPFSSAPKVKMAALTAFEPSASFRTLWQGRIGEAEDFNFVPAVVGSAVYATGRDGRLARFEDGREVWRIKAGQALSGGVGADEKLVAVGTSKGELLVFDADGKPLWTARVGSEVLAPPLIVPGMVIVRSGDSRIYAFDSADGKRRWVYQRSTPALSLRSAAGLVAVDSGILAGFPGGKLVVINAGNGSAIWEATVAQPRGSTELERVADVVGVPVITGRSVCAVAYQGRVGCFELASGNPVWTRALSSSVGLDADDRNVYVADDKGAVHALELSSGASVWKQDKLSMRGLTRPVAAGRYIVVGDSQGVLHALRREDGDFAARHNTDASAVIPEPRALSNGIVVQTRSGGIYAIDVQ
ncbi:MAG: outer membrane protein assembly factor BamB [Rhodocyclaceae bacterium]